MTRRKVVPGVCMVLVLIALVAPASADTFLILPDGSGDFPTIQAGINAVHNGDVIELGDGLFVGAGNRDLEYFGKAITIRSQSGNPSACILDCEGSQSDPHRGFYFRHGETADAVLEGITIAHGFANWPGSYESCGGGAFCRDGASPTFSNVVFRENRAPYHHGGGLASMEASPTLQGCQFVANAALAEGGMWCDGGHPRLTDVTFSQNQGDAFGGGMGCHSGSPRLTGVRFISNHAGHGGGITLYDCSAQITQCLFQGNSGTSGGGISSFSTFGQVSECVFLDNEAADWGAAALSRGATGWLIFESCTFARNAAVNGTLWSLDLGHIELSNCIIAFSSQGEAVYCSGDGVATLVCSDVSGNAGGDWTGCIADQYGTEGNISADPEFCNLEAGDLTLADTSPCAPDNNPECGLIGALPVGCGSTPTIETSWGAVKSMFRR